MFTFKGAVRKANNFLYTTEDKEEIEFLQNNPMWESVKDVKRNVKETDIEEED